jgi:hypothetical protein
MERAMETWLCCAGNELLNHRCYQPCDHLLCCSSYTLHLLRYLSPTVPCIR